MRRLLVSQRNLMKWCGLALAFTMMAASLFAIRSEADPEPPAPQSPAPAAVLNEVMQIGDPEALQPIDLYLDFLDPNSATLMQLFGEELRKQIEDRKLVVNLRLVSYLDPYSASASYFSRALIAMYLVTGESQTTDLAWKFLRRLFDTYIQPHEGALKDLTDPELADIARQVGAPESAADFIATGQDRANVDSHQIHLRSMGRLSGLGGRGTPFATYRGRPFLLDSDGVWLNRLVSPSSSTPPADAQDSSGGITGVNVPHQDVTPGAPITRPSVTLPPTTPVPAPQDGTAPVSENAPAPAPEAAPAPSPAEGTGPPAGPTE